MLTNNHKTGVFMLKGQDIAVITKILIKQKSQQQIEYKSIAYELYISQSEVSKGILRLEKAKLTSRDAENQLMIHKEALMEMLMHGLKYFFPAEINIATRGVATAYSPPLIKQYMLNSEDAFVWPFIHGKNKGLALTPIYKTLPHALDRSPDEQFYKMMSALDLIRLGGSRENKVAREILEVYLNRQTKSQPMSFA